MTESHENETAVEAATGLTEGHQIAVKQEIGRAHV